MNINRKIVTGQDYCAVIEDGWLVEYISCDAADQCGDILLGKIERMMPAMQCAFVDIGRKKAGFLPLDENSVSFTGNPVRSGATVILQVKKEEKGEKGAFLTRDITIPGKYVILMPMNRYVCISSRIKDKDVRAGLETSGREIAGNKYGLVMRNAAADTDMVTLRLESDKLYDLWQKIEMKGIHGGKPGEVLWSSNPALRAAEDYSSTGYELVNDDSKIRQEVIRQLIDAGKRTLHLPSGGNIVIDRCEAMTVIDVNTASSLGAGSKERTVTETNLEACNVISRQVRLRNLSGIILVDFIDMEDETDRSLVFERLSDCFKPDRTKCVIHGWTKLGIMEMTRKYTRPELVFEKSKEN